jgi:hypothetical protein
MQHSQQRNRHTSLHDKRQYVEAKQIYNNVEAAFRPISAVQQAHRAYLLTALLSSQSSAARLARIAL